MRLRTRTTALVLPGIVGAGLLTLALIAGAGGASAGELPVEGQVAAAGGADATGTGSGAAGVGSPRAVPVALQPPAGHVLASTFAASGVQVYRCTAAAWVFVEPVATLIGRAAGSRGLHTAIHFRGPSWESTVDGSLVEAGVVASSPVTGAIPELLLQTRTNRGTGVFGAVTYIQRLATSGGVAPAGACTDEATTAVAYRAEYRFFTAAAAG